MLRKRLWWVLPFGVSLAAGVVFVLVCALIETAGRPGFTGKACFVATIVAVLFGMLVGPSIRWAVSPESRFFASDYASSSVLATCALVFAVPATVVWIVFGIGG